MTLFIVRVALKSKATPALYRFRLVQYRQIKMLQIKLPQCVLENVHNALLCTRPVIANSEILFRVGHTQHHAPCSNTGGDVFICHARYS